MAEFRKAAAAMEERDRHALMVRTSEMMAKQLRKNDGDAVSILTNLCQLRGGELTLEFASKGVQRPTQEEGAILPSSSTSSTKEEDKNEVNANEVDWHTTVRLVEVFAKGSFRKEENQKRSNMAESVLAVGEASAVASKKRKSKQKAASLLLSALREEKDGDWFCEKLVASYMSSSPFLLGESEPL